MRTSALMIFLLSKSFHPCGNREADRFPCQPIGIRFLYPKRHLEMILGVLIKLWQI